MLEDLREVLDVQAMFLILVFLMAVRGFRNAVTKGNIELWHFYATRTKDGVNWGDVNKLGIMVGIFASTLMVGYMFWSHRKTPYNWEMVAVFGLWLTAVFGAEMYSKWARQVAASFVSKKAGAETQEAKP
jgi:uncharacterized protein YacL